MDVPGKAGLRRAARSFRARLVVFVLVSLVIVGAVLHARPPSDLTIETGPVDGSYYTDARNYQKILAAHGIKLRLRQRPNSLEIARDVSNPQSGIDVGFVAQDASALKDAALFSVGQIELQPLFIFASAELGRRTMLGDLRGRKIVMPPADSATSDAAIRVLRLYDITPENSSFNFMPLANAVQQLQAGRFDAGVFMLAPENAVIRSLASDSSLHLVPIEEARAVANHLPFLHAVVLPRGIYNIADAIPPNNIPMVAASVGIVVRDGLHPYLIYALMDAMAKVHHGATFLSSAGEFPTPEGSQLTVHPLAVQDYKSGIPWSYRTLPPWLASAVDKYQTVILGGLLVAGFYLFAMWLADTWVALLASCALLGRGGRGRTIAQADADVPPPADAGSGTISEPDAHGRSDT
jgi:TRAP-type uncharacterized transport system substrate-binding protein